MKMATMVEEEPCQVKHTGQEEKGKCRCYHQKDGLAGSRAPADDVEECCLVKSSYFSRVNAQYNRNRIARSEQRRVQKGFVQLRQEHLRSGRLFVDNDFPPNSFSISFDGVTSRHYEWKRPHEIVEDPHFFIEGATRFDIQQGELGDCWVLAAISTLTLNPRLFHVVVPRDQGFSHYYTGLFHFRFWQYGQWVEVIVDDYLPTSYGRLVFMHSKTHNEFWCALLEKAYAKLYGCYEALRGGNINESMVDMTGGVVEMINLKSTPPHLFTIMRKAYHRNALMGCAIEPDHPGVPPEAVQTNGLIMRHAYSVTRVAKVDVSSFIPWIKSKVKLIRLHNPWGNEAEWKGPWGDKSQEWMTISAKEKHRLGITFDDDGEFWMTYQDFVNNFTTLEICDVTPEVFTLTGEDDEDEDCAPQEIMHKSWKMFMFEGAWVANSTAGGCRNFIDTFALNPQYTVLLDNPDEEDDQCTLVVSLMQKYVRQKKRYGTDFVPIGFAVYNLPPGYPPGKHLDTDFFRYHASKAKCPFFLNSREVTCRFRFPPGVYVVIPSTFDPHQNADFLLRLYTEASGNSVLRGHIKKFISGVVNHSLEGKFPWDLCRSLKETVKAQYVHH